MPESVIQNYKKPFGSGSSSFVDDVRLFPAVKLLS